MMSCTLRFLSSGLILSGLAGLLSARTVQLAGSVNDPQGKPVPGAIVSLSARTGDHAERTTADDSGHYSFPELPAGQYLIEARAPGFAVYHVEQLDVQPQDATLTVDIGLRIADVQQQVVVTAAGTPQTADELSKTTSVVDRATVDQRDQYSVAESLRPLPGVRIEQQGGPGAFTGIRIRGLRNQDTSVLVDGFRLRDPSGTQADASGLIEDLLMTDTGRMEVLRGSGSSLYGTNAIGGVVNLIPNTGGGQPRGSVLLEGGSLGTFRGRAQTEGGLWGDKLNYSLGVTHLNVTNGVDGDDPVRDTSAQTRVSLHLTPTTELIVHAFGGKSFTNINNSPVAFDGVPTTGVVSAVPLAGSALGLYRRGIPLSDSDINGATFIPAVDDPDSNRDSHFFTGGLTLLGHPTPQFGYSVRYGAVSTDRIYGNGPAGVGFQPDDITSSDYWGRIHTLTAQANYQAGRFNLLTGGYEWEDESFSNHSTASADALSDSATAVTQRSNTGFVQDQLHLLGDRLQISGAFRAQVFTLDKPSFQPAASAPYAGLVFGAPPAAYTGDGSIAYFFRQTGTKIRGHVGRGYRVPSLFERFGAGYDQQFGYTVYGDPRLSPEHSISVDGGVDQTFLNGRLRASGSYFYTHLQNVILFDFSGLIDSSTDPFGRFGGYLNSRGGIARGAEAVGEFRVSNSLSVSANYTYTDAREKSPVVPDVYRSFVTPKHQFSTFVLQRIGQRFYVQFTLTASSDYLALIYGSLSGSAYQFPGIKKADLGGSYRIPVSERRGVRIFGNVENFLNQNYFEGGFLTPGITARGGLEFQF